MRLHYEITFVDFLAFKVNDEHYKKSPMLRRARLWALAAFAMIIIGLSFIASEILQNRLILGFGVCCAGIFALIYPRLLRRNVSRFITNLNAEARSEATLGPRVVEIRDEGLFEENGNTERTVFWKDIERIETFPSYTFVYPSSDGAVLIPEGSVSDGNCISFVKELHYRWNREHQ
jgi:hypothetical protein